jgi:hypothetical protein
VFSSAPGTVTSPYVQLNPSQTCVALMLQDSLLGSGHAGDGTVLADRRRDESDLVAAVLPLLSGRGAASPLDAWASHLGKEEATEHPR